MAYCGYVFEMKQENLMKHPNADRLILAKVFETQCIVSNDYSAGELYVFFPEGGQLSEAFCAANDLVRRKDENGNPIGKGYLDPQKRNVKTIRLRKEASEGLILPISSLSTFGDISILKVGDAIDVFNGVEICKKYIPKQSHRSGGTYNPNKKNRHKKEVEYVFPPHIDTCQLRFCLDKYQNGDLITLTEKIHGTSFREILSPVKKKNGFFRRLFKLPEQVEYKALCGSRRITISSEEGGFYGSNAFRLDIHKQIVPHLRNNLEVFGEIVGWTGEGGAPIMGKVDTTCLQDKDFTKKYGKEMIFHYGCEEGKYDFYIYRIAEIDDEGEVVVEYSTDQIRHWCDLHGFKMVPILYRGFIPEEVNAGEYVMELAKQYCEGESVLAPHIREGVVVRRDNVVSKFDATKHKSDYFKILTGIHVENIKDTDAISQDILEEM